MVNLRFAFRMLFKAPFVTTVAIVSLALGIGANAAIFSLFNQVLMRPLPVERPGELVNLGSPGPKPGSQSCGQPGECDYVFSYAMFRDLEKQQTVLTGIAAHVLFGANLAYNSQTHERRRACSSRAATFRCSASAPRQDDCSTRPMICRQASRMSSS